MALQRCGQPKKAQSTPYAECCAISFIRTMTVGSGFAPDLLTLANTQARQALAGCCQNHVYQFCQIPPVGNFTPP